MYSSSYNANYDRVLKSIFNATFLMHPLNIFKCFNLSFGFLFGSLCAQFTPPVLSAYSIHFLNKMYTAHEDQRNLSILLCNFTMIVSSSRY